MKKALPEGRFVKQTHELTAEYLRLFVVGTSFNQSISKDLNSANVEAVNRAIKLAKEENSETVEVQHLQRILPQLLLDF